MTWPRIEDVLLAGIVSETVHDAVSDTAGHTG